MRVQVIILNYRTAPLTIDCLQSLAGEVASHPGCRVVVVDNASGDGSVQAITQAIADRGWSAWAMVLPLEKNLGFSGGNNAGIRQAMEGKTPADYVLLLNPDTIVRPSAIRTLVAFIAEHPTVGIAGSGLENASGMRECSAHRLPTPLSELDSAARLGLLSRLLRRHVVSAEPQDEPHECDWVSGSSMMVRREVFETAGLMDEGFFLYFDEVDFCARAKKTGWSVWHVPASRVVHLEGGATGIRDVSKRRPKYWYDSRRRFFVKSYGIVGLMSADLLWGIGRLLFVVRRLLRTKANRDPKWFAWDLLWGDLQALLTGQLNQIHSERSQT